MSSKLASKDAREISQVGDANGYVSKSASKATTSLLEKARRATQCKQLDRDAENEAYHYEHSDHRLRIGMSPVSTVF